MSTTSAERRPQQPCLDPLGYPRFPFSDAFLSLFLTRPLADRDSFLLIGACALSSLLSYQSHQSTCSLTSRHYPSSLQAPSDTMLLSCMVFLPASPYQLFQHSRPMQTRRLLFASGQCLCNHLCPNICTFFLILFVFGLIL